MGGIKKTIFTTVFWGVKMKKKTSFHNRFFFFRGGGEIIKEYFMWGEKIKLYYFLIALEGGLVNKPLFFPDSSRGKVNKT